MALVLVAGCSATGPVRTAMPGPLREVTDRKGDWYDRLAEGRPAFTVVGGPLEGPVDVPLWLDPGDWYDRWKCGDDLSLDLFELPGGRVYVSQQSRCSGLTCRIRAPDGRWEAPAGGCLHGPTGGRTQLQVLGDGLYFVYGFQEGPGYGEVVRWSPNARQHALLDHVTMPFPIERTENAFVIKSQCNPSTGAVSPQPPVNDCPLSPRCDYCAGMYGQVFEWRWRPGDEPVLATTPAASGPRRSQP